MAERISPEFGRKPVFINIRTQIQKYSKIFEPKFEIRLINIMELELIRNFEFAFCYSKNEYSFVFVYIRPSLLFTLIQR